MSEENIFVFKLLNDESIIGTIDKEEPNGYYIKHPMLIMTETIKGTRHNVFYTWNEYSNDESVFIDKFHVLYASNPKPKILSFYTKQMNDTSGNISSDGVSSDDEVFLAMIELMSSNTPLN